MSVTSMPFRDRVKTREGNVNLLLFRLGRELFAAELAAIEEAVETPVVHPLPEMRGVLRGAFEHRGRMIALYTPAPILGHPATPDVPVALVARAGERRIGEARVMRRGSTRDRIASTSTRSQGDHPGLPRKKS